jgi:hypothetical protein
MRLLVPFRLVSSLASDNVIIAQELLYSIRRTSSRQGGMTIKMDLAKAYDRVDWTH